MTTKPIDLAIDALAAARITMLLTADTLPLVRIPRERLQHRYPPEGSTLTQAEWQTASDVQLAPDQFPRVRMKRAGVHLWAQIHERQVDGHPGSDPAIIYTAEKGHPLGNLISCAWCTGWWVSAGVVLARAVLPRRVWQPFATALATSYVVGASISTIAH